MTPLVELRGIGKQFSGVTVLDDVTLCVEAGKIHSVVGENGAGKSTLMKVLAGVHQPSAGSILLDGETVSFSHPVKAQQHGIGMVYQELILLPERTVAQNIFLGREAGSVVWTRQRKMNRDAEALLDRLGVSGVIRPEQRLGNLSVAAQQMVEIAKALSQDVRVLILDEPTAALSPAESDALFEILNGLAADGIGILYVSHRLQEVLEISDTVTVLKDGHLVDTVSATSLDIDQMVSMMVGRELGSYFPPRRQEAADETDTVVQVIGGSNDSLSEIDLELRSGEVLGIAGLAGSGRTELVQALFGVEPFSSGEVLVGGVAATIHNPRSAIGFGMGYISEDRKSEGLLLGKTPRNNGLLPARAMGPRALAKRLGAGVDIDDRLEATFESVELRGAVAARPVRFLSGGNQQKVVVAKWLATDSRIVLFDEPTRGIDVGARAGIHNLVRELADHGAAVLMVSSELPEVIGMSDRIVVMHLGTIGGVLPGGASEEEIMRLAVGDTKALLTVADVGQQEGLES